MATGSPSDGPSEGRGLDHWWPSTGRDVAGCLALWFEEVLGRPVGVDDDLLRAGADSLAITRIVSRIATRLGVPVSIRSVFDHPTATQLAQYLAAVTARLETAEVADPRSTWAGDGDGDEFDLSPSQERMWFLHQLDEQGSAYNVEHAARIRGPLPIDRLRSALGTLVERHHALRTRFVVGPTGPTQVIEPAPPIDLPLIDVAHTSEPEAEARRQIDAVARQPFDLAAPPLIRARLFRLGDDDHIVLVCVHHIACDQWGMGVLLDELGQLCTDPARFDRSPATGEPEIAAGAHSAAFGAWHRSRAESPAIREQLDYWRHQLVNLPPVSFPTDHPRSAVPTSAGSVVAEALGDRIDRVQRLAAELGVTPFMVYLAVFDLLVERYTGSADVVVGTPVANRNLLESEDLVTTLVNTVVLRTDVSGNPSFGDLVRRVRDVSIGAFEHQDVPFSAVVAELAPARVGHASPLFQVFFNVANTPFAPLTVDGATSEALVVDRGGAQFDLSMGIDLSQSRTAVVEYNSTLFERTTAERMLAHYLVLLDAAVAEPETPVETLPMLTAGELAELDREWTATERDLDESATVHRLFEHQVRRSPDQLAVVGPDGQRLSYRALDERANRLAHHLINVGVVSGGLVGVQLDRSIEMVVAVLAVLKTGAAYVPLDPGFPADRLQLMIDDADLDVLVTESKHRLGDRSRLRQVLLDTDAGDIAACSPDAPTAGASGRDRAYVIYTSGSTGRPKGVELEHRSVVNFLVAMAERPGLDASDVVLSVTTLSFDIAVLELFLPLVVGATVVVVSRDNAMSPGDLSDALRASNATVMQATPSTWRMLVEDGWPGDPRLRVLCGGDGLPRDLADQLLARTGEVWNMYGPTETTVWSAALRLEPGQGPVVVGGPIDNTTLYVLDGRDRLLPVGVPGELCIGGDGLARGYLGRESLTAERFVADPFRGRPDARMYRTGDLVRRRVDGRFEFLGRIDNQVKLRGHRIELGEIEAHLVAHPHVAAAVVVAREVAPGDQRLVAYVVPSGDRGVETEQLRAALRDRLPSYMVPAAVVELCELPLTPNGKVDRAALPDSGVATTGERAVTEPPRPGTETVIAAIWRDVLGAATISRGDDFFDLGGYSLLAVRAFARIHAETGVRLPLSTLFRTRTIAQLAHEIDAPAGPRRWTSLVALNAHGDRSPFFYVSPFLITALSFDRLARHLGPDQPFYVFQPQGMETDDQIHTCVEDMAAHYIAEMRDAQPHGPYRIGGHCAGSWVAFEMARQLRMRGESVAVVVLVDAEPPGIEPPPVPRLAHAMSLLRYYVTHGRLVDAARWKFSVGIERLRAHLLGDASQRRIASLRHIHAAAHQHYEGGQFDGDIVFVRSGQSASLAALDWHLRWRELVGGAMRVEIVEGAHSALVEDANAKVLAAHIRGAVDASAQRRMSLPSADSSALGT